MRERATALTLPNNIPPLRTCSTTGGAASGPPRRRRVPVPRGGPEGRGRIGRRCQARRGAARPEVAGPVCRFPLLKFAFVAALLPKIDSMHIISPPPFRTPQRTARPTTRSRATRSPSRGSSGSRRPRSRRCSRCCSPPLFCFLLTLMPRSAPVSKTERLFSPPVTYLQQAAVPVPAAAAPGSHWVPEADVVRRVAEAEAAAREQADRDGEEAMNDLLVCLGQARG